MTLAAGKKDEASFDEEGERPEPLNRSANQTPTKIKQPLKRSEASGWDTGSSDNRIHQPIRNCSEATLKLHEKDKIARSVGLLSP